MSRHFGGSSCASCERWTLRGLYIRRLRAPWFDSRSLHQEEVLLIMPNTEKRRAADNPGPVKWFVSNVAPFLSLVFALAAIADARHAGQWAAAAAAVAAWCNGSKFFPNAGRRDDSEKRG